MMASSEASPAPAGRPRPAAVGPRSLTPKEHGAYGQLGLPLLTALGMGRPSVAAACLTAAAVAAFLAHEPALVLMGQRGTRAAREDGPRARVRAAQLGALAVAGGAAGLWLMPAASRWTAGVPAVLAVALAPFVLRGDERSTVGELVASAALSSAALPVALAAGVPAAGAFAAWAAWCLVFFVSTFAVRAVIAHAKAAASWPRRLAGPAAAAALAGAAVALGIVPPSGAVGAVPMLAVSLFIAARPPRPQQLKRVGWSLVAASVALAIALIAGAHR
jgi:hypothetical protein